MKSCYNRIVHSVVSLALQRLRILREPVVSMFASIQSIKYIVCTAFGDSNTHIIYAELDKPYQGIL